MRRTTAAPSCTGRATGWFRYSRTSSRTARSFAPDSEIAVAVERSESWCRISIADAGPGIPAAHLERVFERFFTYRPHETAARREHTGLGLSIARTIVEGYAGQITAMNREGGGACFVVELPLADASVRIERGASGASRMYNPDFGVNR